MERCDALAGSEPFALSEGAMIEISDSCRGVEAMGRGSHL